ncbi:PH domain-containing protein [Corynebacterium uterequi]|uniref:Bacterial PH domain n=1 Tax=Corynebacterium uterequi TaxID=1072256 RepID=A0A0G3HIG8_9CORY|nr:PH domain-containing protein [Corynebacterium uterequi]AKK10947.1 Bacterial PH domain [Corynebacterium uterequi]
MKTAVTFRPDRGNLLAAAVLAMIAIIIIGWAPAKLWWLLLAPALFAYWALRARTTVDESGLSTRYAFRRSRSLPWTELAGIAFVRSTALATATDGSRFALPGITFSRLPALSEASGGRIPDVVTAAAEAADGKVEVIDREGHSVLMTQDQYHEHLDSTDQNRT